MNDEVVAREVGRIVFSCMDVEGDTLAEALADDAWNFLAAYILTHGSVGASLGYQYTR